MKRINPSVKSPEGKQTRIGKRVGNMVVIMQVISVVFAVGMCVIMFRSLSMGMLKQRCTNGTNMLSYVLSQTDGTEDVNQLLDELKSRMGCEFTIFEGNTRAYTTVIQNGQRVVGTALSPELSEIVLQKGQSYVGTATILNEQYLCSYVPVRDTSGAISGLLFAGISSAEANRQIVMTVVCSTLVHCRHYRVHLLLDGISEKDRLLPPGRDHPGGQPPGAGQPGPERRRRERHRDPLQ